MRSASMWHAIPLRNNTLRIHLYDRFYVKPGTSIFTKSTVQGPISNNSAWVQLMFLHQPDQMESSQLFYLRMV